jgi:UDP-2,3-diacylglucosamine pyrophosphatase LpxH
MIYFLGDLHISTHQEYMESAILKFLNWFENYNFEEGSTLIQLGDVLDKASNHGEPIKLTTHFFNSISPKFKDIYIIGGNHDFGVFKQKFQYASSYLSSSFKNIHCIFDETILNIDNTTIAVLPFKKISGEILEKYYSEKLDSSFYNCDITCGHVAIKEEKSFFGGIDISKFSNNNFILGHIHSRNGAYKRNYTGSIMPFKINEEQTELPRCIKVYDTDNKKFSEINIPEIIKFESANFGDTLAFEKESKDNLIHLYVIKNSKNLIETRNYYPNNYIYNIEKLKQKDLSVTVSKTNILMTPLQALNMMIKEQKIMIKRKTLSLIKELI